jgi:hypothetical protein
VTGKLPLPIVFPFTFCAGAWLGWQANTFLAQDTCLDRGGAWNDALRSCDFSYRAVRLYQTVSPIVYDLHFVSQK